MLELQVKDDQTKRLPRLDIGNSYKNPRFIRTIYVNERQSINKKFFKLIEPIINIRNYVSK